LALDIAKEPFGLKCLVHSTTIIIEELHIASSESVCPSCLRVAKVSIFDAPLLAIKNLIYEVEAKVELKAFTI
jgi:hypothetical protein